MINIYVANLHAYNCGDLVGEWINLPLDEDELQERLDAIVAEGGGEEYAIHDYEGPIKISDYDGPFTVNEWAERLAGVSYDEDVIEAVLANFYTVDEALDKLESDDVRVWDDCDDMGDVAYQWYEETGQLAEIERVLNSSYVDWQAIGRDMENEGTFVRVGFNKFVEIME